MNELIKFEFEENIVRTISINNEPWFVLKDVCNILGIVNSKDVVNRLDTDEKLIRSDLTSLGQRGGWLVNESGLYSVIIRSDKREAKHFKKWITSEVLPSIRKTGSYSLQQKPLSQSELLLQSAQLLVDLEKKQNILEQRVKAIEDRPAINAPIEHFSIMGYCHNIGVQMSLNRSRKLSYRCRSLCLELGLNIGKVSDSRYGTVNTYPLDVLKEIIGE